MSKETSTPGGVDTNTQPLFQGTVRCPVIRNPAGQIQLAGTTHNEPPHLRARIVRIRLHATHSTNGIVQIASVSDLEPARPILIRRGHRLALLDKVPHRIIADSGHGAPPISEYWRAR